MLGFQVAFPVPWVLPTSHPEVDTHVGLPSGLPCAIGAAHHRPPQETPFPPSGICPALVHPRKSCQQSLGETESKMPLRGVIFTTCHAPFSAKSTPLIRNHPCRDETRFDFSSNECQGSVKVALTRLKKKTNPTPGLCWLHLAQQPPDRGHLRPVLPEGSPLSAN